MDTGKQISLTDSGKYVLSLDSLDLSLLHALYQHRLHEDKALLWSNKKYDDVYYEFVINSQSGSKMFEFNGEVYDTPTIESHMICYICNILVPNNYLKKHNDSSKHKSYEKIANTALKRLKHHNKENIFAKLNKEGLEHFCEHCVSVVTLSNRDDHERSKKHRNFVALDNFLNNFASFYANENENENILQADNANLNISCLKVNKRASGLVVRKDSELEDKLTTDSAPSDVPVNDTENSVLDEKLEEAKVLINNIASCLDAPIKEANTNVSDDDELRANVVNNLKQYISFLKIYGPIKLCAVNSLDQDRIIIEARDGTEILTSVNNFHGFKRAGKKYVHCQLCKMFVTNLNEHKVSEKHVGIVAQCIEDKNCIRHVKDSRSHCIICNIITDDIETHIRFNVHLKKLTESLVSNKQSSDSYDEVLNDKLTVKNELAMKVANKEIDEEIVSTNVNVENNLKSFNKAIVAKDSNVMLKDGRSNVTNNHENQYYCSVCDKWMHVNNFETHSKGTKHLTNSKTDYSYIMRKHKNGFTCKVCNCNVLNFIWAIEDHIASPKHVENYLNLLSDNNIVKNRDNIYCKPCSLDLVKLNEIVHMENQKHKLNLASYNINYIAFIELQKTTKGVDDKCATRTNTKLEFKDNPFDSAKSNGNNDKKLSNITVNCEDKSHEVIRNSNEQTIGGRFINGSESQKEIKIKQDSGEMPLYQCGACNEQIINNPDTIKIHNEGARHKIMDELITRVNKLLEELLSHFNNSTDIHYHLERTDDGEKLKCKICCIKINIEDTEKHINSLKHIHNHRDFVKDNKLKLKDERYICYACNVYVDIDKEFMHIQSQKHIQRIEFLKNGDYVLVTSDAKKLMDKINHDLNILGLDEGVSEANDVELGDFIPWSKKITNIRSNIGSHYAKIIDDEKRMVCVLCQELVLNTDNETHVNDLNHRLYYKEVMTLNQIFEIDDSFVCGFCECLVNDEFDHIVSGKHEENVKNDPRKNFCYKCNISTIDTGPKDHLTSFGHIKNMNDKTPSWFYCKFCNLQLTNSESNIRRHNDGFQHKNNCLLIEENKLLLKNRRCFCQVCDKSFSRDNLEDHINTSKHILLCVRD